MRLRSVPPILCLLLASLGIAGAQPATTVQSRFFTTSDGVRLHYIEAGPPRAHTVVLVPGWTMPGWIWGPQIRDLSARYHVVAFDPRGQGESEVAVSGYEPGRRGQDIAELIARLGGEPVLLVGWSLGVLDSLAYVHTHGDGAIAGLVLVDNSVGEAPAPVAPRRPRAARKKPPHAEFMALFVRTMFREPQTPAYLDRLTAAAMRTPEAASRALLAYAVPREYWREAVYSTAKPVLYVVRPGFAAQAANLERGRPNTETVVFPEAGHALFVDEPVHFNTVMQAFIRNRIWP
jgi:non-heme chloroperoxidase